MAPHPLVSGGEVLLPSSRWVGKRQREGRPPTQDGAMAEPAGKYARFEFERRFLLDGVPEEIDGNRGWRLTDRYIKKTELRLRRMEALDGTETVFKLGQKHV